MGRRAVTADGERVLCLLEDVPDGETRGFPAPPGGLTGLLVVRRGSVVRAFLNSCPHLGLSLDALPGRFQDDPGGPLVCGVHGALFEAQDGTCFAGPCAGDALEAVPLSLRRGEAGVELVVPANAGL